MSKLRTRVLCAVLAAGLLSAGGLRAPQAEAAEAMAPPELPWSFSGVFGTFDEAALQRGFQVYREVCAACHSLKYIRFRNLADLGYGEEQIKAFAAEALVVDGPDDEGEMFEREGRPSDALPSPFPNEKAAAAANNGAVPPDLSLVAKSREGGPDYIVALLTGYDEPPADVEMLEGLNYNHYFPGNQVAMAPPLYEDAVEYADGTRATTAQMAKDVATFLMWAAEPNLETRKQTGIKVVLFLLVFTGLLYAVKRKVWADLH